MNHPHAVAGAQMLMDLANAETDPILRAIMFSAAREIRELVAERQLKDDLRTLAKVANRVREAMQPNSN